MKKNLILSLVLVSGILLTSCGTNGDVKSDSNSETDNKIKVEENKNNNEKNDISDKKREITGLNGEKVILPQANELKRVVVMAPASFSFVLNNIPNKNFIVGAKDYSFTLSNQKILSKLFPSWQNVETSFMLENSFNANIEQLLKLKPDLIFYDAKWQSEGMDKLDIPLVNISIDDVTDVEKISISYEKILHEIFNFENETILKNQWDIANKKIETAIDKDNKNKKTVLFIWNNVGDKVSIYGNQTYVDAYFKKLNIINVASKLNNFPEVSMEQIYQWNPDYIFITNGNSAKDLLEGEDREKDWRKLKAFNKKNIYDVPKTVASWANPSTDSPLMVYWLLNKCYPDKLSDIELEEIVKKYYIDVHNVEIDSEIVKSILE